MKRLRLTDGTVAYNERWVRLRSLFLQHNPLCSYCEGIGIATAGEVVDHIIPHKGDPELFWDQSNWQPLCKWHHDSHKKALEMGKVETCDVDGKHHDPDIRRRW